MTPSRDSVHLSAGNGRRVSTGREAMVGETGEAVTDIARGGRVFVRSEYWNAVADEEIAAGTRVVVESVDRMVLTVKRLT